jgi:hypothetical protein
MAKASLSLVSTSNAQSSKLTSTEVNNVNAAMAEYAAFYNRKRSMYAEWRDLQLKYANLNDAIKRRQIDDSYQSSIANVDKAEAAKMKSISSLLSPANNNG